MKREKFSSSAGFILAAAGSAVGIGNLVAFPVSAAKSGGAVFLLIYGFFVAAICLPVMVAEMTLGRSAQRNPLGAYGTLSSKSKKWAVAGVLATLTPFMIAVFYHVITVWLLIYVVGAATGNLDEMAKPGYFMEIINEPKWIILALIVLTAFIGRVLVSGVRGGIEKLARFMMPLLFLMLLLLIGFTLTMDNAFIGVKYYFVPDLSKLNGAVINSAMGQAFFSLSLGMGILITYGSYMGRDENIATSAKWVALMDTSVAVLAGLLILPAIFIFDPTTDTESLSTSSVSLVFTFLPKIFLSLQATVGYIGASVVASLFFLLVLFAAITSQVSIMQVPLSAIQDEFGFSRRKSLFCLIAGLFLLVLACTLSFGLVQFFTGFASYAGVTKSFFEVIIDIFYDTILPLNGFFVCIFVMYRWKKYNFVAELMNGNEGVETSLFLRYTFFALKTFIPIVLLLIFINTVLTKFLGINLI